MAGHSKWANIKHRKGAQDKKRGKIFSKISKAIMTAVRAGGPDPNDNITLRLHLTKARAANMPRDTIDRAIKKASGEAGGEDFQELTYEGYGPGGIGIVVQTITDNVNRTNSEVRSTLEKRGGTMGKPGSVSWTFEKKAVYLIAAEGVDEEALMEVALEAGADDVENEGGMYSISGPPDSFASIATALGEAKYTVESADITFIPNTRITGGSDTRRRSLVSELGCRQPSQKPHLARPIHDGVGATGERMLQRSVSPRNGTPSIDRSSILVENRATRSMRAEEAGSVIALDDAERRHRRSGPARTRGVVDGSGL